MKTEMQIGKRPRGLSGAFLASAALAAAMAATPAAAQLLASLPGSDFEIDEDANLINNNGEPFVDWADLAHPNGPELRATDLPTGQNDNSYKGGTKEDTECPAETTGSIPNNKSDLLTFHVYQEPDSPGFLNLAWSRVSDPSGTTLMDFEFNQSTTPCPQGPNVVRTPGDLLIEYAIDQGGARANIDGRFWIDPDWDSEAEPGPIEGFWGDPIDLDTGTSCGGGPCAVGTINQTVIPDGESDGLGEKQPRTFGEAQIDLDLIFDDQKCSSFGSAMLKSRSSDSFTSQLKDFIAPIPIDLQNCGNVIIRKQTDPDEDPNATVFGYTKNFPTDPDTADTFTLTDDGVKDFNDAVLFGANYTVDETTIPSGWAFVSVDCSASQGVTPTIAVDSSLVTFDIDSANDTLDCTYSNKALAKLTFVKQAERSGVSFQYSTSGGLDPASFSLADGESRAYADLDLGAYGATETVPNGWNLTSSNCDNGDTADAVTLEAGDDVTCTFVNEIERGAIKIVKTRKHAAAGGTDAHAGVTFTITNGNNGTNQVVQTDTNGEACIEDLPVSVLDGDYTVTESLPTGYVADGDVAKTVSVTESTCAGSPNTVNFGNTPLTNVTVSVDSQVDGGTASTIVCTDAGGNVSNGSTGVGGDGSLTVSNLLPTDPSVTLTCQITIDP
jgi:hypothetical protein